MLGDPNNLRANLTSYIGAFSENTRDIFERYEFEQQMEKLDRDNLQSSSPVSAGATAMPASWRGGAAARFRLTIRV